MTSRKNRSELPLPFLCLVLVPPVLELKLQQIWPLLRVLAPADAVAVVEEEEVPGVIPVEMINNLLLTHLSRPPLPALPAYLMLPQLTPSFPLSMPNDLVFSGRSRTTPGKPLLLPLPLSLKHTILPASLTMHQRRLRP